MIKPILNRFSTGFSAIPVLLFLSGCSAYFHQPVRRAPARLGEETAITAELRKLPLPKEKVFAAVYKFRDQTGQYKPSDAGFNYSTAITQGSTNILLKALEESGWFTPIERENVSNLLQERRIIKSSITQNKSDENLPALLFAGIILEGGIVSYDANIITGGAGLRYFGAGASAQYRQDRVSIYLRAVATKTGRILKTVYTSKTILSQSVDVALFRFVRFKKLLEAETGFTTTEPAQMAVTEAIEKAVYAMVVEGIRDGLWSADDQKQAEVKATLDAYEKERTEMSQTDVYGARNTMKASRVTIQPYFAAWRYHGDFASPAFTMGYGGTLDFFITPHWALQLNAGMGTLATKQRFSLNVASVEANILFRGMPFQRISPLLYTGAGVIGPRLGNRIELPENRTLQLNLGAGIDYKLNNFLGIRACAEYHNILSDQLDGRKAGQFNDYYLRGTVGLTFNLGRSSR
ncbi:MAG: curli production assembly protein CsgG [Cytophagaceae bacterium]|nr:curli production assembly protein CsgG [Cytophagaceae bacterium]